jgi:hypothetical protein
VRYLYLDDSGKVQSTHPSEAVLCAGLSVAGDRWHSVVREITGAKARFVPGRGHPARWELKGAEMASPNGWRRSANQDLCFELVDILARNDCSIYSVGFRKRNATKALSETWAIPLCFQVIAAKFACELDSRRCGGTIVSDWTSYTMDHSVSETVQSYVLSRRLMNLTGGVTFGSSKSLAMIQVADVIAYTLRTSLEGAVHHAALATALKRLLWSAPGRLDVEGFPARSDRILF